MNKIPDNLPFKANFGFSLVDVMVGMVIALLGTIIIFQVFSVSEGIKRTTTSGGDALQNGASAIFALERTLKSAGYGFFPTGTVWTWALPADPANPVPLVINAGAANASDSIVIGYRQNWDFGAFTPAGPSAVPAALTFETLSVQTNCNGNGSTLPQLCSSVSGAIADGIVLMKAEYGTDANGNGVIDTNEWSQAAPANVNTVLAVRVAVVARSAQPEKPSVVGGVCDTTTVAPLWIDSALLPLDLSGNVGLAAGDDWKCYRYKAFENTVPLRNVIWRPS